ncbi:unnamed protein product [Discosporangium mesarthrocarpum]
MADFYAVWRKRGSVVEKLKRLLVERDGAVVQEVNAATNIQRVFRGKVIRDEYKKKTAAAIRITRFYRGHRCRAVSRKAAAEKQARMHMAVFHYHALTIQACYWGFQSRKYNYNHTRRRAYLQEVIDAGDGVREALREHERRLKEEESARAEQEYQEELAGITENLHHLVSTRSISGIFNSPYMRETGCLPTIRGVGLTAGLLILVFAARRTRGYIKRGLETDLNGQHRVPLRGEETRRSIQAQEPYGAAKLAVDKEQALQRLKRVGPREFHAGYHVPRAPYKRGVSDGSPFMEPWRNPYLVRGVPVSQAELTKPLNQTTLGKYPEKPFYVAVGGNKSAVLPNDRFDVILEAEKTGGTVHKADGHTRR